MVPDQADLADCVRLLRNIAWETDESQVRALLRWSILVANRPASPTTTAASDEWGGAAVLLRSSVPILDMWAQAGVPERRAADTVWYVLQRLLAPEHHLHGRPPLPRELTDSLLGEAARRSVVRCLEECPYVEDAERVAATPPEALVCPLCLAAYCGALDVVSVLVTVANSSSTARPPAAVPLHEPQILFPLGRDVCVHIATAASVARSEECMSTLADCWRRAAVAQHHNHQQSQQKPDWDWNSSTAPHFLPFSMSPFAVPSLHLIAVLLSSLFQQQRPLLLEQEESIGRFLALQEDVLHRLSRLLRSVSDVEESLQLADAILHTPLWSAADSYGGGTLLHLLVCCSMTAALRGLLAWLVEHWVTSSSVNSGGLHSPPLTTAVLLNSLSRRNRHRETPLSTAIAHGDEGAVRLLLLHGASAHQPCVVQGKTMLVAPIEAARSSTTVQRLLCAIPTTQATPLSSSRSWIADTPAFEPWHRSNPPPSTTTSSSSSSSSDEGSPRLNQCLATALSASSLATMFCSISERLRLAAQTQYDSYGLPSSSSPVHPKKVDAIARMLLCALQADPWHTASLEAFRTLLLKHAPALVGLQREVHRYLDDSARQPTISLPHSNHKRLPLPRESAVKGGDEPAQRSNHVMLAGCGKAMTHVRVFLDHELRSSVWVALLSPVDLQEEHKHMQSEEAVHGVVAGPTSPCSIVHSFDLVVFRRFSRRHNFAKGEDRLQEVSDDEDGNEVVCVAERVLREGGHRLPLCLSSSYPVRRSAVYRRCVIGCRSERQKSRVDPTGWMTQLHHNTSTTTKQGGVLEDLPTSLSLWTAAWQEPIRRRRVGLSLWAIEVDDWLASSEATTYPGCVGCIVTTDLCRIQEELLRDDPMGTVWAHCTLIVDRESSLVVAVGRRHGR